MARIMMVMLVQEIGEFQLISILSQIIADDNDKCVADLDREGFRLRRSIGEDAAAWESSSGVRVFTTDAMVEGVHFNLDRVSWVDLGWKSMAVNLSDIAAMGCKPLYSVVTLGLRGDLSVDGLKEMYKGIIEACSEYGGAIVGGDIVRSPNFFVSVSLEGTAVVSSCGDSQGDTILIRDGASIGDQIAVTGSLGCSAGGLDMLTRDLHFDDETSVHLKSAHTHPSPRIEQGITLAKNGVSAAIDVSDGLVSDLERMCIASGVGAVVFADKVPIDGFLLEAYPKEAMGLALGGGEDYELLFTAPRNLMDQVVFELDVPVSIIGEIVDNSSNVKVQDNEGRVLDVKKVGWDHFGGM